MENGMNDKVVADVNYGKDYRTVCLVELEENNGWTVVKSIEDMPKKMGHYFVILKGSNKPRLINFNPSVMKYISDLLEITTHIKKMKWPEPPIY